MTIEQVQEEVEDFLVREVTSSFKERMDTQRQIQLSGITVTGQMTVEEAARRRARGAIVPGLTIDHIATEIKREFIETLPDLVPRLVQMYADEVGLSDSGNLSQTELPRMQQEVPDMVDEELVLVRASQVLQQRVEIEVENELERRIKLTIEAKQEENMNTKADWSLSQQEKQQIVDDNLGQLDGILDTEVQEAMPSRFNEGQAQQICNYVDMNRVIPRMQNFVRDLVAQDANSRQSELSHAPPARSPHR